jgi:hypothetical protein
MTKLRAWLRRLSATLRSLRLDDQAGEELRFHLEMETAAAMRQDLSPGEAERKARLRAGVVLSAREAVRDQRGLPWLDDLLGDLRISARGLLRQRGFTAITITALMLAVAINTMIFALVDGVLLQPLPYAEPQRLVRVFESSDQYPKFPLSAAFFLELTRDSQTLDSIALYTGQDLQLMHAERPENLIAVRISHRFLPTLGVQPILGRNFDEAEMRGSPRVVMLSHSLWVNRFEQDPRNCRPHDPAESRKLDSHRRSARGLRARRWRLSFPVAGRIRGAVVARFAGPSRPGHVPVALHERCGETKAWNQLATGTARDRPPCGRPSEALPGRPQRLA